VGLNGPRISNTILRGRRKEMLKLTQVDVGCVLPGRADADARHVRRGRLIGRDEALALPATVASVSEISAGCLC
jgi:hypothetical protein